MNTRHWMIYGCLMVFLLASCRKPDIGPSSACTNSTDPSWVNHPQAAAFQQIIDTYTAKGLPGISVYIQDTDGVWAGAGGMADIQKNIPFQPCTVSKVASITKMFVGTLTLMLVEDGLIALDDKVDPYLPKEVLEEVTNARGATIRQLMQHTTGIYDIISDNGFYLSVLNDPDKHWSADDLITLAYGKDAHFAQGTSCLYSNTNTLLLSMVLDKLTGRPHHLLLRE